MPLYEFYCRDCKTDFEQIAAYNDADQGKCPKCKNKNTQKLVSKFSIKGRGDQRESTFHGCHDHYTGVSEDGSPSGHSDHEHRDHGHDHSHHDRHSHSHDDHPFMDAASASKKKEAV